MLFGFLVLLGGAALAGSFLIDGGASDESEHTGDDTDVVGDEEVTGDVPPTPSESVPDILDVVFPTDPEVDPETDEPFDDEGSIVVSVSSADLDTFPGPLSDWVVEPEVARITAGSEDTVTFAFEEGKAGSLIVMPANYIESQEDRSGDAQDTHTGLNVYFVPEGVGWPEDYEWSEDGASLYNTSADPEREDDFGGITLVARIGTGSFGTDIDASGEMFETYDARLGTPQIDSPLEVILMSQASQNLAQMFDTAAI